MREFFRGWRRKLGCVTLLMACAICVGWLRSIFFIDMIGHDTAGGASFTVISEANWLGLQYTEGYIGFQYAPPSDHTVSMWGPGSLSMGSIALDEPGVAEIFDKKEFEWTQLYPVFRVSGVTVPGGRYNYRIWKVAYWSVVIPLSILSAILLLWPSRRGKLQPAVMVSASDSE